MCVQKACVHTDMVKQIRQQLEVTELLIISKLKRSVTTGSPHGYKCLRLSREKNLFKPERVNTEYIKLSIFIIAERSLATPGETRAKRLKVIEHENTNYHTQCNIPILSVQGYYTSSTQDHPIELLLERLHFSLSLYVRNTPSVQQGGCNLSWIFPPKIACLMSGLIRDSCCIELSRRRIEYNDKPSALSWYPLSGFRTSAYGLHCPPLVNNRVPPATSTWPVATQRVPVPDGSTYPRSRGRFVSATTALAEQFRRTGQTATAGATHLPVPARHDPTTAADWRRNRRVTSWFRPDYLEPPNASWRSAVCVLLVQLVIEPRKREKLLRAQKEQRNFWSSIQRQDNCVFPWANAPQDPQSYAFWSSSFCRIILQLYIDTSA
ncbi:hypothetical protein CSKR_106067 [Clonorchis sinensis]|uniref:Uncharacterized protein n=1 Tax=Clonorchis sinensis TaxID=79923 RepID=A0A419Q744_CLOSI|nr:hypothetical protein CSKR_106067 [Clonorchis sinensis]